MNKPRDYDTTTAEILKWAEGPLANQNDYTPPPNSGPTKHPVNKKESNKSPKYRWGNLTHEVAEECKPLSDEQFGKLIRMVLDYEKNGTVPEINDSMIQMGWNAAIGKFNRMYRIGEIRRGAVGCRKDR